MKFELFLLAECLLMTCILNHLLWNALSKKLLNLSHEIMQLLTANITIKLRIQCRLPLSKQGAPSFSTLIFHDQKMKIHDLSAQVVTVPSARSTIVKKIKRFII